MFCKRLLQLFVSAMFVFVSVSLSYAVDRYDLIKGYRVNGMGGAFTAVADDENAFFYNPAGITQRDGYLLQIISIDAQIQDMNFFTKRFKDISNFDNLPLDEQLDLLKQSPSISLSLPNLSFLTAPIAVGNNYLSFGAGIFASGEASFKFDLSATRMYVDFNISGTGFFAVPVAYQITDLSAIDLPGKLSIGANFKYIERIKASAYFDSDEWDNMSSKYFYGTGFGADLGLLYTFTKELNFGLQVKDVWGTKIKYDSSSASSTGTTDYSNYEETIKPMLNFGVSYVPERIFNIETNNRLTLAADIRDFAGSDNEPDGEFYKKLHVGAEYRFSPFALRLGLNSGNIAFGLGIETNGFQLAYAYFGQDSQYSSETAWVNQFTLAFKVGHQTGRLFGKDIAAKKALEAANKPAEEVNQKPAEATAPTSEHSQEEKK
ncbi:OmpP1/FadL family transporter [Endomicrobium proavitum]|uniref:Uncharacterized protein n=1 Tax=Endomicrobium proavitum TaxID=1408281 RepID=A0A0G3WHL2_9BACT|nr:hypothetical protein [Endomicrobium proavitum]AKL97818.1 exported protein of unknown function [Endomicrobium proavitum]